jgi:hypothetical protein
MSRKSYRQTKRQSPQYETYNAGEHAAKTPHVQAVVVLLEVHQELRALATQGK